VSMTGVDECRLSATHARIKELAPFVQGRVGYIFERNEDYFKYAKQLQKAGIPVFRVQQFFGNGDNNATYNKARSYGYLRLLEDLAVQNGDYTSKDILVL